VFTRTPIRQLTDSLGREQKAAHLHAVVATPDVYAAAASLLPDAIKVASCQACLRRLFTDADNPADPIARRGIKQLGMVPHVSGRLHVGASNPNAGGGHHQLCHAAGA
jgi:hypothetical protein